MDGRTRPLPVAALLASAFLPRRAVVRQPAAAVSIPRGQIRIYGISARLADGAACVVVDDFPAFILPRVTQALLYRTAGTGVPVDAVDANGLVPLSVIPDRQYAAYTIRMLWGKNVIRWTKSYELAQRFMIEMHHRYALDGLASCFQEG